MNLTPANDPTAWRALPIEQRDAAVRRLVLQEGQSYDYVAILFGVTREAIAGFCYRQSIATGRPNRPIAPRLSGGAGTAIAEAREKVSRPRKPGFNDESGPPIDPSFKFNPKAWLALDGSTPRKLEHHQKGECLWPISTGDGPALFCCLPAVTGKNYCPAHQAINTRPVPVVLRKPARRER